MHICILFLILVAAPAVLSIKSNGTRIVGGITSPAVIPYQTALYLNNVFVCGGTLISNKCVLTAAHCVIGLKASDFKVRGGILKRSSIAGKSRRVAQAFVPTEYNRQTLDYDVAILKLKTRLAGKNIATIDLGKDSLEIGDRLKVSGWGRTSEKGEESEDLRYVEVSAIAWNDCHQQYSEVLTNAMFCAAGSDKDACSGDSGGPAVKDNKIYGIVSWGFGCARANYSGVYTSVREVSPWIESVTKKHC